MKTDLTYTDHEGVTRPIKGLTVTQDTAGRYWVWSEQEKINIAYKAKTLDDALRVSIASLLFALELKQERIDGLQYVSNQVDAFINSIRPEGDNDND